MGVFSSRLSGELTSRGEAHVFLIVHGLLGVVELQHVQHRLWVLLLLQLGDVGGLQEPRPLLRDPLVERRQVVCLTRKCNFRCNNPVWPGGSRVGFRLWMNSKHF